MNTALSEQVWARLVAGRSLDGLGLPMEGGRFDLRGIVAPEPAILRQYVTAGFDVKESSNIILREVLWRGIDFSGADVRSLRFFDCTIEDCCFDGAKCQGWRMWGTHLSDSTFRSANLRTSALGGIQNASRNAFMRIDFTKADLRQTSYVSADMVACLFADTKLTKVDFQGTVFVDCTFRGELSEVQFYRQAFRGEAFPPNEMENVDFRGARLRSVEFRGLDMSAVKWPEDDDHIVVSEYRAALARALSVLRTRTDLPSRRLCVNLEMSLKWAGTNQKVGVFSKPELIELAGEDGFAELVRLLKPN